MNGYRNVTDAVADRFWAKVDAGDCWEWTGNRVAGGYGRFWPGGKRGEMAHRFAYQMLVADIPAKHDLDHLCRNRRCVNPDHLEPVTRQENCRRGVLGATSRARALAKNHCKQGHEYDSTKKGIPGHRECATCKKVWARKSYLKRTGQLDVDYSRAAVHGFRSAA